MNCIKYNDLFSQYQIGKFIEQGKKNCSNSESQVVHFIAEWLTNIADTDKKRRKEGRLEAAFCKKILCEVLGHQLIGESKFFSLIPKDSNMEGIPDLKVGNFTSKNPSPEPKWLLELKGPDVKNLWAPQSSRNDKRSAVEQVISDMFNEEASCQFAVATNMIDFVVVSRLFAEKKALEFSLRALKDPNDVYFLSGILSCNSILSSNANIEIDFKKQENEKKRISKEFFKEFSEVRQKLIKASERYLEDDKLNNFTTKMLAQVLFVIYGETIGIIPKNCLLNVIRSYEFEWEGFLDFQEAIDKGKEVNGYELFGYNGGLFAPDSAFNKEYGIEILHAIEPLLAFKFEMNKDRSDVSEIRDILGMVLEHSLEVNEEERIFNFTKEGKFADARKKQATKNEKQAKGVFYTPKSVTKYMVSRVLEINKNSDKQIDDLDWFDLACGSGAFLNEAFEQLVAIKIERSGKQRFELSKDELSKFQQDVVQKISGCDFDPLAVGISQLNLSMRCLRPQEKLPTLSKTIQEKDALFGDLNNKKYNVIVSNPPYMQWRYIPEKYRSRLSTSSKYRDLADESGDYSTFFFRKAEEMLVPGGILAFIATNKLLATRQSEGFRKWLLSRFDLIEIFDFRAKIFPKTDVETAIFILRKKVKDGVASLTYRDVFSYSKSESHLEVLEASEVPLATIEQGPFYCIPSRTSPALLKVLEWYGLNKTKFSDLDKIFDSKSGLRITDIDSADIINGKKPKGLKSGYLEMMDGPCLEPNKRKLLPATRWIAKNSDKLTSWQKDIKGRNWYVLIKEKTVEPNAIFYGDTCPAILNSLNVIFPKKNMIGVDGKKVADWLSGLFSKFWIELWFGANRTHSNQRWKDVYYSTIPFPLKPSSYSSIMPNWVIKELALYFDGQFRDQSGIPNLDKTNQPATSAAIRKVLEKTANLSKKVKATKKVKAK